MDGEDRLAWNSVVGRRVLGGKLLPISPKSACFAHRNTFRVFAASECRPNPMGAAPRGDRQVQFQLPRRNARPSKGPTRYYVFLPHHLPLTYVLPPSPSSALCSTCLSFGHTVL